MLRTVAGREEAGAWLWTGSWTEPSVQTVQSGPPAAQIRSVRADSALGAPGRTSHNPPVVGSSPTRPTSGFTRSRPDVIESSYQENIGPGGKLLVKRCQSKAVDERELQAVAAYLATDPYASTTELAEIRAVERGKDPHQVPYFDLTVSAVKSVSVLHASYRVLARQAREAATRTRPPCSTRADENEAALLDSAREAVVWLEQYATQTGHHSAYTGEWRDGVGLAASLFLHWIRAACTTSGSPSPRSPTGSWKPSCPPSARRGLGTGGQRPAPRRRPGRGCRLRPARPDPRRRRRSCLRPRRGMSATRAYPPWTRVERCECDQCARRRPEQTVGYLIQFRRLT
jgi:hypothetical protein